MTTLRTKKYKSVLATQAHNPVTEMKHFGPWESFEMGFYLGKEVIGGGELKRVRYVPGKKRTCLQTESISLNEEYRRKGHGIHMYRAFIETARKCGAERIYSSRSLNKFSRRMWAEKLAKIYNVQPYKRHTCTECGSKGTRAIGYYIVLKGK